MVNPENIQVFVLTYNRADMLEETLRSLKAQWFKGFPIHVLDNGSTDDTAQRVAIFSDVVFHPSPTGRNMGQESNFARVRELVTAPWVMIFHDDDLLHPQALTLMVQALNMHSQENIAMVGCRYQETTAPNAQVWAAPPDRAYYHCQQAADLAALFLWDYPFHFGAALMRRNAFMQHEYNYETYHKIMDRPFLLDIAAHGTTLVLDAPLVQYRVHPQQDSLCPQSRPEREHWLALMAYYRALLKGNESTSGHRLIWRQRAYAFLRAGFDGFAPDAGEDVWKQWQREAMQQRLLSWEDKTYFRLFLNKWTRGIGRKQSQAIWNAFEAQHRRMLPPPVHCVSVHNHSMPRRVGVSAMVE
jgi:glycosyltransferase involved in cell wall biosynthesis